MTAIDLTQDLALPPELVWAALTDSGRLARWLMPNTFRPEVGAAFTLDAGEWGPIQCTVLELDAPRRLRWTWVRAPLDTTVTFDLEPTAGGTRLHLVHDGFDLAHPQQRFAHDNMGKGWAAMLEHRLPAAAR